MSILSYLWHLFKTHLAPGDRFGFCPKCGCDLFDNPIWERHAKGCPGYHYEDFSDEI